MLQASLFNHQHDYSKSDLAFFDLLKSIADLVQCENHLSSLEIEQLKVGAKALNGLIARHSISHTFRYAS